MDMEKEGEMNEGRISRAVSLDHHDAQWRRKIQLRARRGWAETLTSFEMAKAQVNIELEAMRLDLRNFIYKEDSIEGEENKDLVQHLLVVVNGCLGMVPETFKSKCPVVVRGLEQLRRSLTSKTDRVLITKLLFTLSRFTRLLDSKELEETQKNYSGRSLQTLSARDMGEASTSCGEAKTTKSNEEIILMLKDLCVGPREEAFDRDKEIFAADRSEQPSEPLGPSMNSSWHPGLYVNAEAMPTGSWHPSLASGTGQLNAQRASVGKARLWPRLKSRLKTFFASKNRVEENHGKGKEDYRSKFECENATPKQVSQPPFQIKDKEQALKMLGHSKCTSGVEDERMLVCRICELSVMPAIFMRHTNVCSMIENQLKPGDPPDIKLVALSELLEEQIRQVDEQGRRDFELLKILCLRVCSVKCGTDVGYNPIDMLVGYLQQLEGLVDADTRRDCVEFHLFSRHMGQVMLEKLDILQQQVSDEGPSCDNNFKPLPSPGKHTVEPARNKVSIEDFDILKPISRGAFGRVYLARKKTTDDRVAIKVLRKSDMIRMNAVQDVKVERDILASTSSPFVVSLLYSFSNEDHLFLVMEYASGGDCYSLLKNMGALSEDVARVYLAEVVLALEYLHSMGIVHRDLKPDNLLISGNGHIKLVDFGLSQIGILSRATHLTAARKLKSSMPKSSKLDEPSNKWHNREEDCDSQVSTTDCFSEDPTNNKARIRQDALPLQNDIARKVGTPDYLAPEILLGTGHGPEVDWWSLGVCAYEFVTGCPPFNASSPNEIFSNILNRNLEWPSATDAISPMCKDFIDKLLDTDPQERLGSLGVDEVKSHPFFQGIDWRNLARQKAIFVPVVEDVDDTSYFVPRYIGDCSCDLGDSSSQPNSSEEVHVKQTAVVQVLSPDASLAPSELGNSSFSEEKCPQIGAIDAKEGEDVFEDFSYRNLLLLKNYNENLIKKCP